MAAVKHKWHFELRAEPQHSFYLNAAGCRNQQAVRFQQPFQRAVIRWTGDCDRVLRVCLLGRPVIRGVDPELAQVRHRAHQRTGETGESSGRERRVQTHRWIDHHVAAILAGQVDHGAMSGQDALPWKCDRGCESRAAGCFESAVGRLYQVGGFDPGERVGPIFGSAHARLRLRRSGRGRRSRGGGLRATSRAARRRGRGRELGDAPRAQRIDEARIDVQSRTVDHRHAGRDRNVLADRLDQAVLDQHRRLLEDRSAYRVNARAADSHARGRIRRREARHSQQEQRQWKEPM